MEVHQSFRPGIFLRLERQAPFHSLGILRWLNVEKVMMPNAHIKSFPRIPSDLGTFNPTRETILLVDDHASVRKLLGSILRSDGYSVLEAEGGSQAIEVCHRYRDKIHLLLTDIVMPQMHGHTLAEHIVALRPGIQILYMSGYMDPSAFKQLQPQGDEHFLKKPCDIIEVTRKVRRLLDDVSP